MFCLKYPPSCFLSASDNLAPSSVPPRQPATNGGLAPPGAEERQMGSGKEPPGLHRGAERGGEDGAWPHVLPGAAGDPRGGEPGVPRGLRHPCRGGQGARAVRGAGHSSVRGRREVTTPSALRE